MSKDAALWVLWIVGFASNVLGGWIAFDHGWRGVLIAVAIMFGTLAIGASNQIARMAL